MTGYTKLFSSIISSTIWSEDDSTRIVWITMLAMSDKNGEVQGSVPGLARLAGVSVDSCRAAIAKFLAPDLDSRSKDDEGRRIEEISGGWHLLNHAKYRAMASEEEERIKNAERQSRHRQKLQRNEKVTNSNAPVTDSNAGVTPSNDIQKQIQKAEAEAILPKIPTTPAKPEKARDEEFEQFWQAYPRRVGKGNAEKAWQKMRCDTLLPQILVAVRACKISPSWTRDGGQFIPHPTTWLNRRGWEDELSPAVSARIYDPNEKF